MEPKRERNRKENDDVLYIFANERGGSTREKKSLSFPLCYYSMNISHLTSPMRTYTHTHMHMTCLSIEELAFSLSPSTSMPRRERCCCILIIRTEWYANKRTNEKEKEKQKDQYQFLTFSLLCLTRRLILMNDEAHSSVVEWTREVTLRYSTGEYDRVDDDSDKRQCSLSELSLRVYQSRIIAFVR